MVAKDDNGHVRIGPCADGKTVCGTLVWLREPLDEAGKPKTDGENPDPARRGQPLIGVDILGGFVASGDDEWDDGQIYDPEDGHFYSSSLTLTSPDVLEVEGCFLFFCRAQQWRRVEGAP